MASKNETPTTTVAPSPASQSAMEFVPGPKNAPRLSGAIDSRIAETLRAVVDEHGSVANGRTYAGKKNEPAITDAVGNVIAFGGPQFRLDRNFMRKHLAATFDSAVLADGTPDLRYYREGESEFYDHNTAVLEGAFAFLNADGAVIADVDMPDTPIEVVDGVVVIPDGITLGDLVDGWTAMPHTATDRVKVSYYGKPNAVTFALSIAPRRFRSNGEDEDEDAAEDNASE